MTNSIDPRNMKSKQISDGPTVEGEDIGELAPSEDLMLRVEQLFVEAEELWQWMYNQSTSTE